MAKIKCLSNKPWQYQSADYWADAIPKARN